MHMKKQIVTKRLLQVMAVATIFIAVTAFNPDSMGGGSDFAEIIRSVAKLTC